MPDRVPKQIRAAGAVLWRHGADGLEVALVHRPRYGDWSFPKGKLMAGEHVLLAAVREVGEETGEQVALGRRLATTAYLANGRPKQVDYWAARPRPRAGPAAGRAPAGSVPNAEVDNVDWLSLAAARERISYARDVEVLAGFAAGPPQTTHLILLRHAAAVSRKAWWDAGHRDDLARPLSDQGQAQAEALAEIMNCFPEARVISSGAERCLATVRPYAKLVGSPVEAEPAFTLGPGRPPRGGSGWTPAPAAAERLAGATGGAQPAIICAHRENLPTLLAWACQQLAAPVPAGPELGPGAFWVLHASEGTLASAELHSASS